jgi:hypothetical protein
VSGCPPKMIREVGESSGAHTFAAARLLAAAPVEGECILELVRFSRVESREAEAHLRSRSMRWLGWPRTCQTSSRVRPLPLSCFLLSLRAL